MLGTDYGDALDRLPPARGGGPSPDYPTQHANQGAYSLAFGREWLGADADEARATRELDAYDRSRLELRLRRRDGSEQTIALEGPTAWKVEVCDLHDGDGDGLEEVAAHLAAWDMRGTSERWGAMAARLAPVDGTGRGWIEERRHGTPGILDLPPFAEQGTAEAAFTVALDLDLGHRRYRLPPTPIYGQVTAKPPPPYERLRSREPVALLDADGAATGIMVLDVVYVPGAGGDRPPAEP